MKYTITIDTMYSRIVSLFHQKAATINTSLTPLSKERQRQSERAITIMAKDIPEAILVGGWALRLHLQQSGSRIPYMPHLDIDFIIDQENYDRVRDVLRHSYDKNFTLETTPFVEKRISAIQTDFKRKGEREFLGNKYHNFMESPHDYMALEVQDNHEHIDLFASEEEADTQTMTIKGITVKVLTPEELYIRRLQQIRKTISSARQKEDSVIKLPKKQYQYFMLTGNIIDETRMQELWKKRQKKGRQNTWEQETVELLQELDEAFQAGTIVLTDTYH